QELRLRSVPLQELREVSVQKHDEDPRIGLSATGPLFEERERVQVQLKEVECVFLFRRKTDHELVENGGESEDLEIRADSFDRFSDRRLVEPEEVAPGGARTGRGDSPGCRREGLETASEPTGLDRVSRDRGDLPMRFREGGHDAVAFLIGDG